MKSTFENTWRTRSGEREIMKVYNFLMDLIIKNNYEANAQATSESISEYFKYHGAYSKTDSFSDYMTNDRRDYKNLVYTYMSTIKNKSYSMSMGTVNTLTEATISNLQKGYDNGLDLYKDYLLALRVARVYKYDEKNPYYRQFMGLPNKKSDYIYVTNFDISEDGFSKVEDYSKDPIHNMNYYTKVDGEYVKIGPITSWYDPDTGTLIADEFYYLNLVAIHEVTYEKYPYTYSYYIQQKNINTIIAEHEDLNYLRFIGKGYTAYYLHELPNYSIIQYGSGILDTTELEYFFKAYNKARQQVVADYIDGFDKKQPLYNLLMLENLLYYTVINYTNSYIEKYSVDIYSEENLNDILSSHGYSKLSKIKSIDIKRRIVRNLNDLISNKGNNYILELILNRIICDENSELKRYYLEKQYNVNDVGEIDIDTSRGLENSVKLVLREVPATQLDETSATADSYKDYDSFTTNDNFWGGVEESDTQDTRNKKREQLKRQLLALNFNSILTRYITLTKTVDILDSQRVLRDSLYLMFNYFDLTEYPQFFYEKVTFESFKATPSAVFAAMCWVQQMKYYSDPDLIIKDNIVINNSACFRNFGKLAVDRQSFENTVIYDGTPMTQFDISADVSNWRIHEFITENPDVFSDFMDPEGVETERIETVRVKDAILQPEYEKDSKGTTWTLKRPEISADGYKYLEDGHVETIEDSMPVYRFYSNGIQLGEVTAETTFADIMADYNHQMPNLIARITMKLAESYDFNAFQAWMFLQEQARKDNSIEYIFKGVNRFSDYIDNFCESNDLSEWMEQQLKIPLKDPSSFKRPAMADICFVLEFLTNIFKNWVNNNFSSEVYKYNDLSGDTSYINDMRLLFNEFLSVYSELYSIDFKYALGDKELSDYCLGLYYNPINILFSQKLNDQIELSHEMKSKIKESISSDDEKDDTLSISYDYFSRVLRVFEHAINNDMILDEKTNEYIPEDPFKYEKSLHFGSLYNDWIGLDDEIAKFHFKHTVEESVGNLSSVLKVKTSEGVKEYNYE